MGLLGITSLDQATLGHLYRDEPVMPAHEMSSFSHIPSGQVR